MFRFHRSNPSRVEAQLSTFDATPAWPYVGRSVQLGFRSSDGSLLEIGLPAKAKAAGATVLVGPYTADRRNAAVLQFPGGYIAEVHSLIAK
jgi:hypothetical protein